MTGIDLGGMPLVEVVVHNCSQQVVRSGDGMQIAGEVEIDILHGQHLRVATSCSPALEAHARAQRGFSYGHHGTLADQAECLTKADGGRGLSFTHGSRRHGCYQDQLSILHVLAAVHGRMRDLCYVFSIRGYIVAAQAH